MLKLLIMQYNIKNKKCIQKQPSMSYGELIIIHVMHTFIEL